MSSSRSSPHLCVYCQQRPVTRQGDACWPCQSYEAYLALPYCDCPHEQQSQCRCTSDCEEDCPALEYYYHYLVASTKDLLDDGV
jgi:hypothetical protein